MLPHQPVVPLIFALTLLFCALIETTFATNSKATRLKLSHIFHRGTSRYPDLFKRLDIDNEADLWLQELLTGQTFVHQVQHRETTFETSDKGANDRRESLAVQGARAGGQITMEAKTSTVVKVPDYTDPATVLSFAKMCSNAYLTPDDDQWNDVGHWNATVGYGWENDGIRAYVFTDNQDNLVLAYKGTSASLFGIGGETSAKDKYNDNMMFSCCCGKAGPTWRPICDCCGEAGKTCSQKCLSEASHYPDSYYLLAQEMYLIVRELYPAHTIYLTGHSLGGALASLVALTNNVPAFSYESPGDLSFARRLGLVPPAPNPVPDTPIYHFGNLGDPVFTGTCHGPFTSCWIARFAMETKCHLGKSCVYDPDDIRLRKGMDLKTFGKWVTNVDNQHGRTNALFPYAIDGGMSLELSSDVVNASAAKNIRYHQINNVIRIFLEDAEDVPECVPEPDCMDCELWEFAE
ncbi:hypothetical protein SpCBS45565_g04592 [Spizellomyces sp. 'palustris']|nr:hypothetical protein SpCBS45565_g04592 [Spizellomyces sp. 'palustris']